MFKKQQCFIDRSKCILFLRQITAKQKHFILETLFQILYTFQKIRFISNYVREWRYMKNSRQTKYSLHFGIRIKFTKYFILAGPFLDDLHIGKGFGLNPSFQIVQHFACIWIKRKSVSSLQNSTLLHNSSYDSSIWFHVKEIDQWTL